MQRRRSVDELTASAIAVIDTAFSTPALYHRLGRQHERFAGIMAALYSGGHDSLAACHVASQHPRFDGKVHHIRTGIGAQATWQHVQSSCKELGWELASYTSRETYEKFVRERGFPGPGRHHWVYLRLKDRCVRQIVKGRRVALVTGCRSAESTRRMGNVEPLKIGETKMRKGVEVVEEKNRYWSAPCHDWTDEEQHEYIEYHDLPRNPLKATLGMSGECFCGAFAKPNEIEAIRRHAPDVAAEIDRLAEIAKSLGKHAVWGTRPPGRGQKGVVVAPTGPLCAACDVRAVVAGIVQVEIKTKSRRGR